MKQLTFLKSFFLLCALMVGSSSVWGQVSTATATNGKSYVVAYYANSKYYALPHGTSAAIWSGTEVSVNAIGKVNTSTASSLAWTLTEGTTSGQFYLTYTSGNTTNYLQKSGGTGNNNKLNIATSSNTNYLWEFSLNSGNNDYTVKSLKSIESGSTGASLIYLGYTSAGQYGMYGSSSAAKIILLEIGDVPAYSITAQSNNTNYGTVTLDGSVITGAPKAGYRYADPAYTVSPTNSATVTQDGDNFTVIPSANTTITINFEAIPTHALTSAISPTDAGTVTFGSTTILEGANTTATATANAGYKFKNWSVSGTGATLSSTTDNPTTVTMGTADATVTATFEAVTTYAIKWSVNGTVVQTDNVEENTAIAFPTSITGIPDGYVLKGWVTETNKISGTQATDPTYVTEATSTENITYYAVMAVEVATPLSFNKYEKVTEEQDDWSGTYLLAATYSGGSNEDLKGTFVYSAPASSEKYGERVALTPGTTEYTDYEIIIEGSANGYTIYHNNSKKYFGYNGSNNELNFYDEVSGKKQEWTITDVAVIKNAQSTSRILKYNGSSPRFACYTSGQTAVDLYKRIETGGTSYSNFCTTVPTATVTIAAACNDGKGVYYGTYSNASAFVVPDDMTVSAVSVDGDGKLVVTPFDEGDIVKAGTGVMVSSTTSGAHTITLATGGTDIDGNMLKGSGDAAISASDMSTAAPSCLYYRLTMHGYVENVNPGVIGFYWGAADGASFAIAANKAYLAVPEAQAAKMSGFAFDDTTTGINGVEEIAPVTKTRKVVKNGRLVIETANGEFTIDGARMK